MGNAMGNQPSSSESPPAEQNEPGASLRAGARPCHSIRDKQACWARAHCMRKDKRCVPRDYNAIARGEITLPRGAATGHSLDTVVLRARPIRKVFHIDSIVRVNGEWAQVVDVLSQKPGHGRTTVLAARPTPLMYIKERKVDVPRFELGASTMPR